MHRRMVLAAAFAAQLLLNELPCPLCLLQRLQFAVLAIGIDEMIGKAFEGWRGSSVFAEFGYERDPAPWSLDGIPPDFNGKLLEEDWPRFEELMENAIVRVPSLAELEAIRLINGPEAFTPDNEFILGESEVRGFFVAAGFLGRHLVAHLVRCGGKVRASILPSEDARPLQSLGVEVVPLSIRFGDQEYVDREELPAPVPFTRAWTRSTMASST
mgnify:CR=1 FL=1